MRACQCMVVRVCTCVCVVVSVFELTVVLRLRLFFCVYRSFFGVACVCVCCCAMHICEYDATVLRAVVFAGAYMCSCV